MWERTVVCRFWSEFLREGDKLEESGVDGRIILRLIFRILDGRHRLD